MSARPIVPYRDPKTKPTIPAGAIPIVDDTIPDGYCGCAENVWELEWMGSVTRYRLPIRDHPGVRHDCAYVRLRNSRLGKI